MRVDDPSGPQGDVPQELLRLPRLNLPAYEPILRGEGGKSSIYDPIRNQYVRLTPEEWVRQHFLRYLTYYCGYPASLMAIEKGFQYQGMLRRADVVVHDRQGRPFLMVECKAPGVPISQSTFDQVSRYNRLVSARYLAVTNGMTHYCWTIESDTGHYRFLDGPPAYHQASANENPTSS